MVGGEGVCREFVQGAFCFAHTGTPRNGFLLLQLPPAVGKPPAQSALQQARHRASDDDESSRNHHRRPNRDLGKTVTAGLLKLIPPMTESNGRATRGNYHQPGEGHHNGMFHLLAALGRIGSGVPINYPSSTVDSTQAV